MSMYWNKERWELTNEPQHGVRIPVWLALLIAPLMGAGFVLFLPFAGVILFLGAVIMMFVKR